MDSCIFQWCSYMLGAFSLMYWLRAMISWMGLLWFMSCAICFHWFTCVRLLCFQTVPSISWSCERIDLICELNSSICEISLSVVMQWFSIRLVRSIWFIVCSFVVTCPRMRVKHIIGLCAGFFGCAVMSSMCVLSVYFVSNWFSKHFIALRAECLYMRDDLLELRALGVIWFPSVLEHFIYLRAGS